MPVDISTPEELITWVNSKPVLKKWYEKFSKKWEKFSLNLSDRLTDSDGFTEARINYFLESKYFTITIFRASLDSAKRLTENIMHEFGHANSYLKGFYQLTNKEYSSRIAKSIDEIYANRFANKHVGASLNTPYYKSNIDFLKNNNINLSKIKFPSYD